MKQRPIVYWNEDPKTGKPWHRVSDFKRAKVQSDCGHRPPLTARWASEDAKPRPLCSECLGE